MIAFSLYVNYPMIKQLRTILTPGFHIGVRSICGHTLNHAYITRPIAMRAKHPYRLSLLSVVLVLIIILVLIVVIIVLNRRLVYRWLTHS